MKISLFRGSYTTLKSTEIIDNFDSLCDIVSEVKIGQKNGDYFIRGFCDGDRSDVNVISSDLIIIDGDRLIDNPKSCCPPYIVHESLKKRDITHVIYSSYSNDLVNNIHKWRLCVPTLGICDENSLKQGVGEILSILHSDNIMVANVKENLVLSQPWFTPRCHVETEDDFYCAWHDGSNENYSYAGKKILDSVNINYLKNDNKHIKEADYGHFSWEYMIGLFSSGTVHNGLKSAIGWIIHTTDWADSQIKSFMTAQVEALCPDQDKINRVKNTNEIDSLINYCRKKHGVIDHISNWKDNLITAKALKSKEFDAIRWAVDGVIPEGLTILAGDPKAGKSLMAVDICCSVSSGAMAFGKHRCVCGDCVYISLEDPERRVKDRIKTQCDVWPERFKLLTGGCPQIGDEFYKLVDEFVMLWPELRCIVIDTMQFLIPPKPNNIGDYEHYYKLLDPLHAWAIDNHVSVVLITHTTKSARMEGDNKFHGIHGSVAIQGCADAMLVLQKTNGKKPGTADQLADGFLYVQGREIGAQDYALDFDEELLKWTIRGEATSADLVKTPNQLLILKAIEDQPMTPVDIASVVDKNRSTVRSCLKRLVEDGKVIKVGEHYQHINYINEKSKW